MRQREFQTSDVTSLATDLAEPALDALLDSGVVKEIPVLGAMLKIVQITASIPNLIFSKKVQRFVDAAYSNPEMKKGILGKIESSDEKRRTAGEAVVMALDRSDDLEKASIIGWMFSIYLIGKLDLVLFRRLCRAVDLAFVDDLKNFSFMRRTRERAPDAADFSNLDGTGLVERTDVTPPQPHVSFDSARKYFPHAQNSRFEFTATKLGGQFALAMSGYWHNQRAANPTQSKVQATD